MAKKPSPRGPAARANKLAKRANGAREDIRFWLADEPYEAVFANWKRLGVRTRNRRMQDLYYACLYDDAELATEIGGLNVIGEFTPQTLSANITRRQADTFVAKIAKNRPVPMGLTTGGNYSEQRRAKALSQCFAGILDEVRFWPTRTLRLRDGAVFGSGTALNYRVGRKLHHDRFFPFEARVDPRDARYGHPRTLYIGRYVDRLVAKEQWPDLAEEIEDADSRDDLDNWKLGIDDTSDVVLTVEAWHLPSGEDAKDGKHVIAISNATLKVEDYDRDTFPISKFDFAPGLFGWWGEGMVKQLAGLQYEINGIGLRLQERHYLMGTYLLREANSEVDYETVDNGSITELVYQGKKPEFEAPAASHPDLFQWFQFLRGTLPSDITGLSQLTSRSEIPQGLSGSGKSLRTYHDIETEAFTPQGRADEQDVIDTCWQLFDLVEEIYEETGKEPEGDSEEEHRRPYTVRVEDRRHGRSLLKDIKYEDVRLDREKFRLRIFPTNFLSGTPEDKFATVKEMTEAGFLSEDEGMILLDFPDVQHVMDLRTSARRLIERLMEKLKEASKPEDVYEYPEPAYNLDLCLALGQMHYLEARLDGVEEDNCKWILQFAIDADDMKNGRGLSDRPNGAPAAHPAPNIAAAAGSPAEPGGPPGGPSAPPPAGMAPPTQPLLPAGATAPTAIPNVPPGA